MATSLLNEILSSEAVVKSMLPTKLRKQPALLLLSLATLTNAMLLARDQTGGNSGPKPAAKAEQQVEQPKDPAKHFTNRFGMKFVWILPGSFLMGSGKEEEGRRDNETQHRVTLIKGFYMGVHTVTQEQWMAVMGNNPSEFKDEKEKNLPVETVSWNDCQEFIKKLRQKDNKAYRLPTEAEWEFCCRAGTKTPFSFGETISPDQANYNSTFIYGKGKQRGSRGKTSRVDLFFPANGWGLRDLHGNVWQWCQDWYGDYPQTAVVDPHGPATGRYRVLRGGSWRSDPQSCRSAFHDGGLPSLRDSNLGFRLCFCPD